MPKRRANISKLFADSLKMGVAANQVIAMRLTRMAFGHLDARRESKLMVSEKMEAAAEATVAAAKSVMAGKPHRAPGHALAAYKKRVNRNLRRLSKP